MGEADSYYHNSVAAAGQLCQPVDPPPKYEAFETTFKIQRPKYNDVWAGVLFVLFVLGFTALSGIALQTYASSSSSGNGIDDGTSFTLSTNTVILFSICAAVALLFGYGYVLLARSFPRALIWVTGIVNIVFTFGTGIVYLVLPGQSRAIGIVFVVFGVALVVFFWTCRRRIPFSALLLRTSVQVAKGYGHVFLVSFLGGVVAIALGVWFAITIVAIYVKWEPSSSGTCTDGRSGCSHAKATGLTVFAFFAMYWMSEWLKNTIHTTVCGVYGSWFYAKNSFPDNATRGAFKRSVTYSFGSVSLGSMLVAIVNFLQQATHIAMNWAAADGNMIGYVLFCLVGCVISVLQWALQMFNTYAFVHVALYGKPYIKSAKDTWKMIKDRGFDALINECLVGPVLSYGALAIGYMCALVAYIWLRVSEPSYNQGGSYTSVIMGFVFLIGIQTTLIFTTPILSGIETIFVASAWDPEVLMNQHRDLYDEMVKVYPHVQQAIHA